MKHILKHIISGLAVLATVMQTGCSDDVMSGDPWRNNGFKEDTQLVLSLALPAQTEETRAEMHLDANEGKVNDLWMLAFGYDGGEQYVRRELNVSDLAAITNNDGLTVYEINGFKPGKYSVYVVANMGEAVRSITTEDELKKVICDFTEKLPEPGRLPMVYEPGALLEIAKVSTEPATIETPLRVAAVKVKYNIIFDKDYCLELFGEAGLKIKKLTVENIAEKSYLIQNRTATSIGVRSLDIVPAYYNDYTEDQTNASSTDKDVIEVTGEASGTPASFKETWVCSGTLYLPERYVAENGTPTTMQIEAVVTDRNGSEGSVNCKYSINLAAYDGNPNEVNMPRGGYYEVIGKVKTLGTAKLDSKIYFRDWTDRLVNVNVSGTYLTLTKTEGTVTSLSDDEIGYETDAHGVPLFTCGSEIGGVPVILGEVSATDKKIKLCVNPSVSIDNLPNDHGNDVATCWIQSGNIHKQIKVAYDITPFFIITPLETKVQWSESDKIIRTKEYSYRTNLGGLMVTADNGKGTILIGWNGSSVLQNYTSVIRDSKLQLSCTNPSAAMGTMTVTANTDPGTSTIHNFDAYPAKARLLSKFDMMKADLRVTVMPPMGGYRIYFRAVNDWHKYDGGEGNVSSEWFEGKNSMGDGYPTEYYGTADSNNNWFDYWYCKDQDNNSAWSNSAGNYSNNGYWPHEDSHRIYIWTQEGERLGNDANPPVWRFTSGGFAGAPKMSQDFANAGWYYYDLSATDHQKERDGNASGDRIPEPGTTLMIFGNHTNAGSHGFTVHRVPGHLEPGVPLFDYEDREGWVLYDPTTESLYRIFDERPVIEDVVYTIYSDAKPTGWWRKYGIATKDPQGTSFPQFNIYSNNVDSRTTEVINGKTYYVYKIKMKAARGYYAKAININFEGVSTTSGEPQRVYYYNKNGWTNPRVYIYKDGSKHTEWGDTPEMKVHHSDSGGTYYYYDIPEGYSNGRVIFQDNGRNNQIPGQNQAGFELNGKSKVYYADTSNWTDYSVQPNSNTSGKSSVKLFGGRQFSGNTGYFNSTTKTWTAGKPQ